MAFALACTALALGCSSTSSGTGAGGSSGGAGGTPFGAVTSGEATYYDATGAGNCSFDATPNDLDVAAMNAAQYAGSAVCGECVTVNGPKGKVTVRIVDQCPDCDPGQLDLSQEAFAKIADVAAGRVPITWQAAACAVTGNVAYHYKDGSNPDWTAIQVRNHKLPIAKLEIQKSGVWTNVTREDYNYFVDDGGAGSGPVHVRITAVDGQTLEDTLPAPSSDVTVPGAGQFE